MLHVPTLLLSAVLSPQIPTAQEPAPVLDILSLHTTCPRIRELPSLRWFSMLEAEGSLDLLRIEPDRAMDQSLVVHVLQSLNQAAWENGELTFESQEGELLLVRGPRESVAKVRTLANAFADTVGRPLELEFAVWPVGDATPSSVLTAAQYREFTAGREPLWRARAVTASGVPVALNCCERTSYLRDFEVEIAKKAAMPNPVVGEFLRGAAANVLPFSLVGGDEFVLHVQATWSELRSLTRTELGMKECGEVDSPTVASACAGFSGRIQADGALCAVFAGDPATGACCVMTASLHPRGPRPDAAMQQNPNLFAGLRALPIGALTTRAATTGPTLPSSAFELPTGELDEVYSGTMESERIAELVRSTIPEEQREGVAIESVAGWLLVRAPEPCCARIESFLSHLQDRQIATRTVAHEVRNRQGEPATAVRHRLVLPTLTGRFLQVIRRVETPLVCDIDVEVAEDSRIGDPKVRNRQLGCWLTAVVGDRNAPELDLQALCIAGAAPEDRRLDTLGRIQLGSTAQQTLRYDGPVAVGAAIDHGDGPVVMEHGKPCRSVCETTVR